MKGARLRALFPFTPAPRRYGLITREGSRRRKEDKTPPNKITGVGDGAFWLGSRVGGALYVLKGNNYVRVSVGGAADEATKIRKSKALAQKALARL